LELNPFKWVLKGLKSVKKRGIRLFLPSFHAGNRGANPLGDARDYKELANLLTPFSLSVDVSFNKFFVYIDNL